MNLFIKNYILNYLARLLDMLFPMRTWLNKVSFTSLKHDAVAGVTGAFLVIPQGIAFAIIAGLPPQYGLYSAIIVQLVAGFFGSSLQMVTGPTVALSIVIPSIIINYADLGTDAYITFSLTLMFLVSIIQLCFGLFRLGSLVNFISHTVIIGFTAGASILIIMSQLPTYLGITVPHDLNIFEKILLIIQQYSHINFINVTIASSTLIVSIIIKKINRKLPYMLIGMFSGTFVAFLFFQLGFEVNYLGALPHNLANFQIPQVSLNTLTSMFPSAFALAMLGLIEAASIARSIGMRSGQNIDSNQEFFGQGLANFIGSFSSCYVGSGSFSRSAINYDSGAKTPLALLFTSIIVILILWLIPWITEYLPIPAMAGAIILAGYNLLDFKTIKLIAKTSRNELSIILVTFVSTLLLNLEFAIYAGVILSLILYLQKTTHPMLTNVDFSHLEAIFADDKRVNLNVLRLDGSLFFGSVAHVQNQFHLLNSKQDWQYLVILGEGLNIIDISGLELLLAQKKILQKNGGDLFIIGMKPHVRRKIRKTPYWKIIEGDGHLFESTYIAFAGICKSIHIENYRQFMKLLFRDYNKLSMPSLEKQL